MGWLDGGETEVDWETSDDVGQMSLKYMLEKE